MHLSTLLKLAASTDCFILGSIDLFSSIIWNILQMPTYAGIILVLLAIMPAFLKQAYKNPKDERIGDLCYTDNL